MAYNYGPPPPPPVAAHGSPTIYQPYGHAYQQAPAPVSHRGSYNSRGRGASSHSPERGGYPHSTPVVYSYGPQQPPQLYTSPSSGPYAGPQASHQASYHAQQPLQQPQWSAEQAHQQHHHHHHSQQPPQQPPQPQPQHQPPQQPPQPPQQQQQQGQGHVPLPAQNYHPNYAPQIYQSHQPPHQSPPQQLAYNPQQPYPPAGHHPAYGSPYPAAPVPQAVAPIQQWGGVSPQGQGYFGGGRGHAGYHERVGKSHIVAPPIRMGFDTAGPQGQPAPVSNGYVHQPVGAVPGPPAPYAPPAPYPGYPPAAPYMAGPPQYDGSSGHNSRAHSRGGFHANGFKSRGQFGGDKMRNRNRAFSAQTPPSHHQKPDAASAGKKKKRKTNPLGLTPGDESDEDDDDEERLKELYGSDAPNPVTSVDIAEWIEERKANFPTRARIEAKKAGAKAHNGEVKKPGEDRDAILEKQQQRAEKLRRQLEKVESSIKRKREQQDEGDEMRDVDDTSSSSDDSKSDDDKPEVMSTRTEPGYLPPPPKRADPTKQCKYYSTGGTCGKKGKCRFVHDPAIREAALKEREMNGGRMTLQQRLILNDKEQEDMTIVKTLKYLQDKGVLKHGASNPTASDGQPGLPSQLPPTPTKPETMGHGLPPIPPPSVIPKPTAAKYTGWNLSGFGNTGVNTADI